MGYPIHFTEAQVAHLLHIECFTYPKEVWTAFLVHCLIYHPVFYHFSVPAQQRDTAEYQRFRVSLYGTHVPSEADIFSADMRYKGSGQLYHEYVMEAFKQYWTGTLKIHSERPATGRTNVEQLPECPYSLNVFNKLMQDMDKRSVDSYRERFNTLKDLLNWNIQRTKSMLTYYSQILDLVATASFHQDYPMCHVGIANYKNYVAQTAGKGLDDRGLDIFDTHVRRRLRVLIDGVNASSSSKLRFARSFAQGQPNAARGRYDKTYDPLMIAGLIGPGVVTAALMPHIDSSDRERRDMYLVLEVLEKFADLFKEPPATPATQ